MSSSYKARITEQKWQKKWNSSKLYKVNLASKKPKYYNLVMFPYPSGDKLHVGHWYNFAPADSWGRYKRMTGFNVFEPMGFDSFGLPAENYAIKTGVPPQKSTEKNIVSMIKQLGAMGTMYDWDKTVATSRPDYYKWSQWVFLQLYKKGLAYKKDAPVNWCSSCQTVLANEQVQDGKCDRCSTIIIQKNLYQWFFKISDYSEALLDNAELDWPEKTKIMQKNWIGKSSGCNIHFRLEDGDDVLTAYTTRPDTIYSVTFVVMAPEHPLLDGLVKGTKYEQEVKEIRKVINRQSIIERTSDTGKDKIGCFTGKYVINPVNGAKIPVYVANFALMYGTGIVMADAHDQRDFEFARKYSIPLKFVISENGEKIDPKDFQGAYTADGILFDSAGFNGMNNREALPKIMDFLEGKGFGQRAINYKLRDWLLSRQRYWGAPIPIINCPKCGEVPVPDKDLPVVLPIGNVDYKPKGKAPLASVPRFVNTKCPKCKGKANREVDTMDTFICSSWYYLRYLSAKDKKQAFDVKMIKKWMPVDMYIGGPEHACMHLLYARFIHKVLMNDTKAEPFKKLVHQGLITKNGAKMSKSKGNAVSPDEFVEKYGSDVFRMYLMFMGPFTDGGDWSDKGITGLARFVERFWTMLESKETKVVDAKVMKISVHKLIKKISEDIEKFHFNTAVASLMEFTNLGLKNGLDKASKKIAAQLIAPLAPHLAEECWSKLGGKYSIFDSKWPKYDAKFTVDDTVKIGVQVNGKVRGEIEISKDSTQEEAIKLARANENVLKYLTQGQVVKEIYVPGRIVGFVVK
ncbi:leucine--tRNA ligase [Candidatus Gracilibacteria bacterium]|nr:leucine--tRNA ligase [Candidatus Gracilibacteria bacterium]